MTRLRVFLSRLSASGRPRRRERDIDEEIASHLAEATEEYIGRGLSPEDAHWAALRSFGGVTRTREIHREVRSLRWVDDLRQDLRQAVRTLARNPAFTLVVVLTLALGIGANTAIFTLLDAVVFKPLPVPAADELLVLYEKGPEGTADSAGGTGRYLRFSHPRFERLQQALGAQGSLAAVTRSARFSAGLRDATAPHFLRAQLVSGRYFDTLGVSAARGRVVTADDVERGRPVAVISDGYWKRVLGASEAVGKDLVVNGVSVTVIGVAPPRFSGIWTDSEADAWLPLTLQPLLHYQGNSSGYGRIDGGRAWAEQDLVAWLNVVARIAPQDLPAAVPRLRQANQEGVATLAGMVEDSSSRKGLLAHTLAVESLSRGFSGLRGRFSQALFALGAMVALVLLVTCSNIANLFLARAASRTHDMGVRIALGAARGRLVRQCLTESLAVAFPGGAAGIVLGGWASRALAREVLGAEGPLPAAFSPDARVLGLGVGLSLATGVVFGLVPALRALAMAGRGTLALRPRSALGPGSMRGMRFLVIGQLALSAVIVFSAMLFGRTLVNFTRVAPGFSADRLVTVSFDSVASGYTADRMPQLGRRLVAVARSVPEVTSAAVSRCGLIAGCSSSGRFDLEGAGTGVTLYENWVSSDYFLTAGIPLVSGRTFDERDVEHAPRVAIVNESIARRYFPGRSPLGSHLGSPLLDIEIVGVVGDAHTQTLREPPVPMVYFPMDQKGPELQTALTNLDVRVPRASAATVAAIREALRRAEPGLLLEEVTPMSQRMARDLTRERLVAGLASSFAFLVLILASLGLYGVLSYNVARRTQEIGLRMALGAHPGAVVGLVLGQSVRLTVTGLAAGVLAIAACSRSLSSMLHDVAPHDPPALAAVFAVFVVITGLASYLPARRAMRVDPLAALRSE